jgi:TatA/E family protein of Tat protein translocase
MPTPGPVELIIILVIALIILGPGRLPDVGSALGKSIREFRKASTDIQESVKVDVSTAPLAAPPAVPPAPPAASSAPAAPVAAPTAPVAADTEEAPDAAPVPQPAVAPRAADLPGAPTVASTPGAPSNEPQTGTN